MKRFLLPVIALAFCAPAHAFDFDQSIVESQLPLIEADIKTARAYAEEGKLTSACHYTNSAMLKIRLSYHSFQTKGIKLADVHNALWATAESACSPSHPIHYMTNPYANE